jgi:hypothetical protein
MDWVDGSKPINAGYRISFHALSNTRSTTRFSNDMVGSDWTINWLVVGYYERVSFTKSAITRLAKSFNKNNLVDSENLVIYKDSSRRSCSRTSRCSLWTSSLLDSKVLNHKFMVFVLNSTSLLFNPPLKYIGEWWVITGTDLSNCSTSN